MRILHVYGDDDFGACTFEQQMGMKKLWKN